MLLRAEVSRVGLTIVPSALAGRPSVRENACTWVLPGPWHRSHEVPKSRQVVA
jgi:hypothetical protein